MDQVAGSSRSSLNGQPIAPLAPQIVITRSKLTDLAERNVLVLEIETPAQRPSRPAVGDEWGMIAWLIRRRTMTRRISASGPGIVDARNSA